MFKKVFVDSFTEIDGKSFDVTRFIIAYCAVGGISIFFALTVLAFYKDPTHHFGMQDFAMAFTTIMGGIAMHIVSLAVKQKTDNPVPPEQDQTAVQQ
jgi:hypothetical protein